MPLARPTTGWLRTPDGADIAYAILGRGSTRLTIIPGESDGFTVAADAGVRLAWAYRRRSSRYRILILSRRQPIIPGYTVSQHANDVIWAIERLNWGPSVLECESGGGPIGHWVCVKQPDLVRGLILSSTFARPDDELRALLQYWALLAGRGNWNELRWSQFTYSYRPRAVARWGWLRPLLGSLPRPRYPERLGRILLGLIDVDNRRILSRIECPTLVIGGEADRVVDASLQREMERMIPNARLKLYPGHGHANNRENPDYPLQVEKFIASL